MKKISQIEPAQRQIYIDQVNHRWGQLYHLEKEWHAKAWNYLFLTNAGGAIAMLSFLSSASLNESSKVFLNIGLSLFVFGVAVVGICIAKHYHHLAFLFKKYKQDANKFLADQCAWEYVTEEDNKRVTPTCWGLFWGYFWPYLSFVSFIAGCLIGGYALLATSR